MKGRDKRRKAWKKKAAQQVLDWSQKINDTTIAYLKAHPIEEEVSSLSAEIIYTLPRQRSNRPKNKTSPAISSSLTTAPPMEPSSGS
jgi:hypothetical protein